MRSDQAFEYFRMLLYPIASSTTQAVAAFKPDELDKTWQRAMRYFTPEANDRLYSVRYFYKSSAPREEFNNRTSCVDLLNDPDVNDQLMATGKTSKNDSDLDGTDNSLVLTWHLIGR